MIPISLTKALFSSTNLPFLNNPAGPNSLGEEKVIQDIFNKILDFLTKDIWRISLSQYSTGKSFMIRQLRIIILAFHKFGKDKCQLRASSLTYYTLLAIVPVVALAFGVAKGFGLEKLLEKQLLERIPGNEEVLIQIITFAQQLLDTTKGGLIAGIGVVILFWSAIKVLNHIESSINDVWEIEKARPMGRKLSNYFAILFICPILIILSSSVTVFINTKITLITEQVAFLGFFSPMIFFMLKLLPYCLIWTLFTLIYILIPSTKVNISSGVISGIVAGTIYQGAYWAYIVFQVGVSRFNAIYGSLAAFPLFLVWLQLSWLILLLGAEYSFAQQNSEKSELGPDSLDISLHFKKILSLQVAYLVIKQFQKGEKPLTVKKITHLLKLPFHLAIQIMHELVQSEVISETVDHDNHVMAFQPAVDINMLTVKYIIDALELRGAHELPVTETAELKTISDTLQTFGDIIEKSSENKLLKDI